MHQKLVHLEDVVKQNDSHYREVVESVVSQMLPISPQNITEDMSKIQTITQEVRDIPATNLSQALANLTQLVAAQQKKIASLNAAFGILKEIVEVNQTTSFEDLRTKLMEIKDEIREMDKDKVYLYDRVSFNTEEIGFLGNESVALFDDFSSLEDKIEIIAGNQIQLQEDTGNMADLGKVTHTNSYLVILNT